MPESSLPRLMTIPEAAAVLRCSRGHIYSLIAAGKFRAIETKAKGSRSKTRIYESDLAAFIEANTRSAPKRGEV